MFIVEECLRQKWKIPLLHPGTLSSRFKIPSAVLEEGQSLIPSSTSLPHNTRPRVHTHTHTHTHTLPDCWTVPVIADPLSGMACANQRNVLLPLEKGAFHNHALRILLCESCLWLSSGCLCVQVSSFQRFPYIHYISRGSPVIPEWWSFFPQLITYGVWEFHFLKKFVFSVVMFNICGQGIVNI